MIIELNKIIGKNCSQRKSIEKNKGGDYIRKLITDNWDKEKIIKISFKDIKTTTPSFIDEAIGKLVLKYTLDSLREKLRFVYIKNDNIIERINHSVKLRIEQMLNTGQKPV